MLSRSVNECVDWEAGNSRTCLKAMLVFGATRSTMSTLNYDEQDNRYRAIPRLRPQHDAISPGE